MTTDEKPYVPNEKLLAQAHPAFRFVVTIDKLIDPPSGRKAYFGAFTECTLPTLEWEIEEVKEGGLNTRTHQLRGRRKAARLVLKYGVCKDEIWDWYKQCLSEKFEPKNITIELLDVASNPVAGWHIEDAYPIKWTGPQFQASSNAIAIQTLEFACGAITLDPKDLRAPGAQN